MSPQTTHLPTDRPITHRKLRWFTGGHAYQLALDRRTLRRDDTLKDFHELIKRHSDAGSITRQETVSMIPPVVLDVQPHHRVGVGMCMRCVACGTSRCCVCGDGWGGADRGASHPTTTDTTPMPARWRLSQVLDMCAAPGSKTSQMLEVVNSGCGRSGQEPAGYVLANDSETSRAYMLVHQCKRISTAVRTFLVHACVWKRRDDSVAPHRATFLTSSRTPTRAAHARTHARTHATGPLRYDPPRAGLPRPRLPGGHGRRRGV